jgi:hypothetical protein
MYETQQHVINTKTHLLLEIQSALLMVVVIFVAVVIGTITVISIMIIHHLY